MKKKNGFTLVELLIVISILGVLTTIGLVTFTSAQMRSRDTQRKSDLKQISTSLELFYADYGKYPISINGQISACPYEIASQASMTCTWGAGEFRDENSSGQIKTTYFKTLPKDPSLGASYYYRTIPENDTTPQKFQLFARLENTQDSQIIVTTYNCGTPKCNFAITSANTNASE